MSAHFEMQEKTARHPRPGRPTVYACPAGHFRASAPPFSTRRYSKQVWCSFCARPIAGCQWVCACGKI
eukprot:5260202-Karenia_brevis.AAC.1